MANLNILFPSLEAYYANGSWDAILRTHLRIQIQRTDGGASFGQSVIQPLELCLASMAMFHVDENLFFSILEEVVELCPTTCLLELVDGLERMSPQFHKDLIPGRGKALILLRICNDLIKRTQHHWVSLRGRVFLLVCSLFPINERSGLNLRGIFSSIEMDKISSAMQGEKSSKQHLPNGPELSPHEQLLSCPPELDINCPFGIFILFFHALDELLDTWEFYWAVVSLQRIFSLDLSLVLQAYNAEEGAEEDKMWWSSFRSILEILIKASYSEALLERLKFPTGSTMMKSSQDRQQPWRYFYSRDLFVHQVWLVSVIRDQIRNSLYFWFSLFCQLIEFLISLRKLLASFQEDTSEQKKRKIALRDEAALVSLVEKFLMKASSSPLWALTIEGGMPLRCLLDALKMDEEIWKKWRESGSHDIVSKHELEIESKVEPEKKPPHHSSFSFVRRDYSFFGEEVSLRMEKPTLASYLSILGDEDPNDMESLFHDSVFFWKALRLLILHDGYKNGSSYDLLLRSIGSNVLDDPSITGEDASDSKSEVGILYSEIMKESCEQ